MVRPFTSQAVAVAAMLVTAASVSAAGLPADWRPHRFGAGRAQVSLPLKFKAILGKSGTLEAQTAGPNGQVRLFFDLHLDAEKAGMKNGAEAFVRDLARKKKLK